MNTITCPRCGARVRADAMNCDACRINLRFALENPVEIERLKQEDTKRERLARRAPGQGVVGIAVPNGESLVRQGLLLLGSFVFAFCLGEAVHEVGHYLAHRAFGVDVGIRLDPFGGSRILHGSSAPREIWGITSVAGPLLNLLAGMTLSLSLWWKRRPALLPLLLWGPIALVQEGVTFSLGMLTPGGDAQLIVDWGVPAAVLVSLGVLSLALGISLICGLLPLVNLSPADTLSRKFIVVTGGMVSFMFLRLLVSSFFTPDLAVENTVPLVFALLLASIVVMLYGPLYPILNRISRTEPVSVTWPVAAFSMTLGAGVVMLQLASFN
jgi:hypothetical protein